MNRHSVINSNQLQLMVQFMQQEQIALSEVFDTEQLALLSNACAGQQVSHIPVPKFALMLRQLADYMHQPSVALLIAQCVNTANLGVLGYLLHACDSMGEALLKLMRYGKLIMNNMDEIQVRQAGADIELHWPQWSQGNDILLELGMAVMRQFSLQLAGQPLHLNYVHFMHDLIPGSVIGSISGLTANLADEKARYEAFFGCEVYFNQPHNIMSFPVANLSIPIEKPDKALFDILQQQAEAALKNLPSSDIFLQQAQRQLMDLCQQGEPSLAQLAERLHLSTRTLQRRLAQHQLSFQQLLDDVRQQLCRQYLQQQVSLSDIAQLVGYSDQSAFTRAYKRWTGTTPLQQRRHPDHNSPHHPLKVQ